MRIAESELIINDDGSVFHIHLRPGELADKVILVGDPGRVDMVAGYLDDIEFRHESREFVSVTGKYKGVRVTVLSTGIGTDNIDIVMNELDALANIDFNTREVREHRKSLDILRIGTSGAIQPDIPIGLMCFRIFPSDATGFSTGMPAGTVSPSLALRRPSRHIPDGTGILQTLISYMRGKTCADGSRTVP